MFQFPDDSLLRADKCAKCMAKMTTYLESMALVYTRSTLTATGGPRSSSADEHAVPTKAVELNVAFGFFYFRFWYRLKF